MRHRIFYGHTFCGTCGTMRHRNIAFLWRTSTACATELPTGSTFCGACGICAIETSHFCGAPCPHAPQKVDHLSTWWAPHIIQWRTTPHAPQKVAFQWRTTLHASQKVGFLWCTWPRCATEMSIFLWRTIHHAPQKYFCGASFF